MPSIARDRRSTSTKDISLGARWSIEVDHNYFEVNRSKQKQLDPALMLSLGFGIRLEMVSLGNASSLSRVFLESLSIESLSSLRRVYPRVSPVYLPRTVGSRLSKSLDSPDAHITSAANQTSISNWNFQCASSSSNFSKTFQTSPVPHHKKEKFGIKNSDLRGRPVYSKTIHLSSIKLRNTTRFEFRIGAFFFGEPVIGNFRCFCLEPKTNRICYIFAKSINSRLGAVRDKWKTLKESERSKHGERDELR